MAKMFYTLDEAKAALGKSEDEIKAYAREGRLREFRDGPRLMFKSDQIEAIKSELSGGGRPDLGVSDTGAPIGLADSRSSSGTGIRMDDPGISGSGLGSGLQGAGSGSGIGGMSGSGLGNITLKDDTALAADLGLSGSVGGVPSPARVGTGLSGSMSGSRVGINVFGDDADHADPMAQTNVSPAMRDQISLEAVGSGSGLLDLTRESDDTSLGADTLDEILPGSGRNRSAAPLMSDTGGGSLAGGSGIGSGVPAIETSAAPVRSISRGAVVREVEAPDASAGFFGGAALGAAGATIFALFAVLAGSLGATPDLVATAAKQSFWILTAIMLGIAVLFGVFGLLLGKAMGGGR